MCLFIMHSFRIRYVVLGLLVYIQSAFGKTCGSQYEDVPSSSVLASVVFEGTASAVESINDQRGGVDNLLYNLVQFKVRRVFKGDVPRRPSNQDRYASVLVGKFGRQEDKDKCISGMPAIGQPYVVFLNSTERTTGVASPSWQRPGEAVEWSAAAPLHFPLSAMPVPSSKRVLRQVRDYTCKGCVKQPRARLTKSELTVTAGKRLQLQCKVQGKPPPQVKWFLDGNPIASADRHYVTSKTKRGSRLRIRKATQSDAGQYSCQALSASGQSDLATARVSVLPVSTSNRHHVLCKQQTYCLNGGVCYQMTSLGEMFCECKDGHGGNRCQDYDTFHLIKELEKRDSHSQDRTRTIAGLVIGAVVLALICITSYILAKRKRIQFHKRRAKKRAEKAKSNNGSIQPLLLQDNGLKTRSDTRSQQCQHTNRGVDISVQTEATLLTPSPSDDCSLPSYDRPLPSRPLPRQNTAPSCLQVPDGGGCRPRLNGVSITPDMAMYRPPTNVAVVNAIVEPDREEMSPQNEMNKLSDYEEASDLEVNMESEADVAGLDDDDVDHGRRSMEPLTSSSTSEDEEASTTSDSSIGEEIALFQQLARNPRVPSTPSHTSQNSLTWPSEFATPHSPILSSPRQPPPPYIQNNGYSGVKQPRSDVYNARNGEFPFPYDPDPDATVV